MPPFNQVVRVLGDLVPTTVLSADTAIKTSPGVIYWISLSDTAALAIELNDSTNNTGTDRWAVDLPADGYGMWIFDPPIQCALGIYLDVSTGTCKVVVGYK